MKASFESRLRRCMEIFAACAALVLVVPLLAAAASLIVASDGGPVFFRQERIGRNGRRFRILKFRTMRPAGSGPLITSSQDSRITRVGRWLRLFKIDELPQLANVMRGEMSWIGPRPEVPRYVNLNEELWKKALQFKPGITDAATLAFRDEEELLAASTDPELFYRSVILPQKLMLNLRYQASRSFRSDAKLLWMTARYSFVPRGFNRKRILETLGV